MTDPRPGGDRESQCVWNAFEIKHQWNRLWLVWRETCRATGAARRFTCETRLLLFLYWCVAIGKCCRVEKVGDNIKESNVYNYSASLIQMKAIPSTPDLLPDPVRWRNKQRKMNKHAFAVR